MKRVALRHLALLFMATLVGLTAVIGGFAYLKSRELAALVAQYSATGARRELDAHIVRLADALHKRGEALARWDETRLQFVSPEYYAFWRTQRVRDSGLLPAGAAVELFKPGGEALASPRFIPPGRIAGGAPRTFAAQSGGRAWLFHVVAVHSDDNRQALLGYGVIREELLPAVRQGNFHFIDPATLDFALADGEMLDPRALAARARFALLPREEQRLYERLLTQTVLGLSGILLFGAVLTFWIVNRLLVKPMRHLARQIERMRANEGTPLRDLAKPLRVVELEEIRSSLYEYQMQLAELHGTLAIQNQVFRTQARQDALTRCHNRRAYEEDWSRLVESLPAAPQDVAYLLFDCDRFKPINDTYGHAKGDRVLVMIADALVMALRAQDRLYRIGGDEFATILAHTTAAQAKQIAQRCQAMIEAAPFAELGITEPIAVSIGIAVCPREAPERIAALPKQADIAMYSAKQPGHHKIVLYDEVARDATDTLVASRETSALFQALAKPGMIEMAYQPIHALPSRRLDYFEALARIRYAGELLMPQGFLPVVASRRLEAEFDLAVLMAIEGDLESAQLPAGCGVSINLSAQSLARPEIVTQLLELSRHADRHPLMLEITETSLITQIEDVRSYLDLLRSSHYKIAMDDFGTGYSPMRYLVDLPVDSVKFDISLVRKLAEDDRAARIVADFARMMADAGYALVAEGVEDEAVLARVAALGFAHVQGFLLGRPMPLAALAQHCARAQP
jgi:diguanylate cyclase (GGDEF)-like protein